MKSKFIYLPVLFLVLSQLNLNAQEKGEKIKPLLGGSASIGYGIMTDNISEYVNNELLLPITFDLIYKNFVFQINLDGGYSKIKKSMEFDDGKKWHEGDNAWHNQAGVNLGYGILNNDKIIVSPYVGYSLGLISKKWLGASDISEHEPSCNYLNTGIFVDIKKKRSDKGANKGKYAPYSGIRFTLGAYVHLGDEKDYPQYFNGSIVYLSVGIPLFKTK